MPAGPHLLQNIYLQVGLAIAVAAVVIAAIVMLLRKRESAEERERLRRQLVYREGRVLEGFVTEVDDQLIHFNYNVSGVVYEASQDISALRYMLPAASHLVIGPTTLKYLVNNPANSIVVCEEWTGLRQRNPSASESDLGATSQLRNPDSPKSSHI
jgi:hypothetical protein